MTKQEELYEYNAGKADENKEWREGRRCTLCGKPKEPSVLSDTCDKCLEEG